MLMTLGLLLGTPALLLIFLRAANRAISTLPAGAEQLIQEDWTRDEVQSAYTRAQDSPTDMRPFLFAKQQRRYVVAGGSGLVGGWIVHHLLMRGEDPRAIRILDLAQTKRKEAIDAKIDCVITDVSNLESVSKAFSKKWPSAVAEWPLTVFHTVAYIHASERKGDFLPKYVAVNVLGTRAVLDAAKAAKATCFIATSSASVGITPPSYFIPPFNGVYQLRPNADHPKGLDGPLDQYGSCYAWSKAQAEKLVRDANDPDSGFFTGAIRPGHAIYGHGVENSSSITFDYLRRGGAPSWIHNVVANFVCAQNVSIGHLAYENALLNGTNAGGKGYCVTDPNPPIRYGMLYDLLGQLADPSTPINFPPVPHIAMLLLAHVIESYVLLRRRYLSFLPEVTGDLYFCQPAVFNMCTLHLVYTDTAAQEEIGYRAPITTLEGFALAVDDWNKRIEAGVRGKTISSVTGAEVLAT